VSNASDDQEDPPQSQIYTVGYGRPPLHTRFQPGQSGNRPGRPKGARNLATELKAVLAEVVLVREGERSRKVPKLRALVTALVNRGLKGDQRAAATLITTLLRLEGVLAAAEEPEAALAAEDTRILERALARAVEELSAPDHPEDDQE
jgi:hypothetical protein